jgi:hypothetical protein
VGTHSVEANQGITPTIAHVPTGIVHGLPPAELVIEKVPTWTSGPMAEGLPTKHHRTSFIP